MKFDDLANLISKVDPKRIESLFPSKEDQNRFEAARKLVIGIIGQVKQRSLDPTSLEQIETVAAEFRDLYQHLSPRTELASKATLNEAVLWAELGSLERSIFLAGVAREKQIREPFRSQLNALPSHACCSRFRQITRLSDSVKQTVGASAFEDLRPLFDELRRSYLAQFVYFAGQAYLENQLHPKVGYDQCLASLIKAFELEQLGRNPESDALTATAYQVVDAIPDPTEKSHYMELQYHQMNAREFSDFRRLSARHIQVQYRLKHLADIASRLKEDGKGRSPAMAYAIAPIVGWGARSASVVGILISLTTLLGWDPPIIQASVNALWVQVAEQIPQIGDRASMLINQAASHASHVLANTTLIAAHTGGLSAHTGGMGAQLAALASHTGGFA